MEKRFQVGKEITVVVAFAHACSKYYANMMESSYEMPDFGLPYLQGKFGGKDSYLEDLYKRYEQRAQVGE